MKLYCLCDLCMLKKHAKHKRFFSLCKIHVWCGYIFREEKCRKTIDFSLGPCKAVSQWAFAWKWGGQTYPIVYDKYIITSCGYYYYKNKVVCPIIYDKKIKIVF